MNFKNIFFKDINGTDKITSYSFFEKIVPVFSNLIQSFQVGDSIVFNLTDIVSIEPIVIPYLASLADWCNSKTGKKCFFKVMSAIDNENLPLYLSAIGFKNHFGSVFQLEDWGYSPEKYKEDGIRKNTKCAAFLTSEMTQESLFDASLTREAVWSYITPKYFRPSYLTSRADYYLDDLLPEDLLGFSEGATRILGELTHNALYHGQSNCFLLCEYLKTKQLLKIGLSDSGKGMLKTYSHQMCRFEEKEVQVFGLKSYDACLRAILECLLLRIWYKNGLFGVIYTVLRNKGTLRIHSDYCQIVIKDRMQEFFTPESMKRFSQGDKAIKQRFLSALRWDSENPQTSNVRKTTFFPGVHFEIEMPIVAKV